MYLRGREIPERVVQRSKGSTYLLHILQYIVRTFCLMFLVLALQKNTQNGRNEAQHSQTSTSTSNNASQPHASRLELVGKYQSWSHNTTTNGAPRQSQSWGNSHNQNSFYNKPRYEGTGANVTPLGTPARMSPVTTPPPAETEPKQKSDAVTKASGKVVNDTELNSKEGAGKEKNNKKRKAEQVCVTIQTCVVVY